MSRLLARLYHWASWRSGQALRHIRSQRGPRVLTYHGIGPNDVPVEQFEWQLRWLRDEFDLVPVPVLVDRIESGQASGHEVALTFDDGVRNHFTHAWPLLRAHRVPATLFVCPGLIDSGCWIWNMEMRMRLRMLDDATRVRLAQSVQAVSPDVEKIIARAKQLSLERRLELEQAVRDLTTQFEPSEEMRDRFAPLQWEQVKAMDPALVTIGSHSLDHPILTTLPEAEQRRQVRDSRVRLEEALGRTADLFCYPNGSHDPALAAIVAEHYRAAFVTRPGFTRPDQPRHQLHRISAGARPGLFLRRLHRPTA